jgi:hypothetical protein
MLTLPRTYAAPGVRTFYLGLLAIESDVLRDVELTFYNNKLVQLRCSHAYNTEKNLYLKTGAPKMETRQRKLICPTDSAAGPKPVKQMVQRFSPVGNNIEVLNTNTEAYGPNCKIEHSIMFTVKDVAVIKQLEADNRAMRTRCLIRYKRPAHDTRMLPGHIVPPPHRPK